MLALAGCSSTWDKYPPSLYTALREETPVAIEKHEKLLERIITEADKSGKKPPAGIEAEYAYYSWRLGMPDKAREALRLEGVHYPESRQFLSIMDRFLPTLSTVEVKKEK